MGETPAQTEITFRVDGIPKGQPRARAFAMRIGGGKFSARMYDPGTAEAWKGACVVAGQPHQPAQPFAGAVRFLMVVLMPRPKSMPKRLGTGRRPHLSKPDWDNHGKGVCDALTQAGWFVDDAQVYDGRVVKFYAAAGERPGAEITITLEGATDAR